MARNPRNPFLKTINTIPEDLQWLQTIAQKVQPVLPVAEIPATESSDEEPDEFEPLTLCVLTYNEKNERIYFSTITTRRSKRNPQKFVSSSKPFQWRLNSRSATDASLLWTPEEQIIANLMDKFFTRLHLTQMEFRGLAATHRLYLDPYQDGKKIVWNKEPKDLDLTWEHRRKKIYHRWVVKNVKNPEDYVIVKHVEPWVYLNLATGEVGDLIYPQGLTFETLKLIDEAPAVTKSRLDAFSDHWERTFGDLLPSPRKGRRFTEVSATLDAIKIKPSRAKTDWFDFQSNLKAGEHRIELPELAAAVFAQYGYKDWPDTYHYQIPDTDIVAKVSLKELEPILRFTLDLLNRGSTTKTEDGESAVAFSRHDLALVETLPEKVREEFSLSSIHDVLKVLRENAGKPPLVPLPKGINAQLRPYQHEGYSWLQFWREHEMHGILADDMGLGKTLQVITHLQKEKEIGRSTDPALIVVPASLVSNWKRELRKFAPGLRKKIWHGQNRILPPTKFAKYDVVITTYALAWRDAALLREQDWSILVLDEAQTIKNKKSLIGKSLREFSAKQRLCLSGTPMENHLGELWSLFDFLMPGFLGSSRSFSQFFRNPIEREQNQDQLDKLRRWIHPFMVRRTKDEVATELPAKNEIVQVLPLGKLQAQAYEAVRIAMQKKVIQALSSQGLASSYIMVLDALLKLRQVCCDPTLLNVPETENVKESAKLDWLRETLPEMVEEGRRILIFSQFVQMLQRIQPVLEELGIPYTMLTGKTTNRESVIDQFRKEQLPVFLISLKAGGVGLNLTEADTVILFDPWWNPAVEAQAIDRTHRIGQDKPVFVYKLITEGTVEEKIMELQAKKKALFKGILSGEGSGKLALSESEIQNLFSK